LLCKTTWQLIDQVASAGGRFQQRHQKKVKALRPEMDFAVKPVLCGLGTVPGGVADESAYELERPENPTLVTNCQFGH
jgi:hypothetical protein